MNTESPKKYVFFCPQGTLLLKDNLYIQRQGSTAENGGQLIYTIEIAQALAQAGHEIDIFARNYHNDDYESHEVMTEILDGYPNVRVIHVPTGADPKIEKEQFYPYYSEYMARALPEIEKGDYDYIIGHYADGMFMAAAAEEHLFRQDGVRRTVLGITHSLGKEKADSLITKIKADPRYADKAHADIYLTTEFNAAVEAFNIKPRLACEIAAVSRMDGMIPISHAHFHSLFEDYCYPEDQMRIIPGGINQRVFYPLEYTDQQKQEAKAQLIDKNIERIGEDRRELVQNGEIVLGFGRMVVAKGIIEAVKSMKDLLQKRPDAVYMYIGGNMPPQTDEEKKVYHDSMNYARQHGYEDRVIFLGRQDQGTINEWLGVSQIYLHAAHLEPFGLAPQEAASTGIPVVMSKYAGACDVLKNNEHVLHTDPHNPADIAKQVGRLLENSRLAERLSQEAVDTVQATCTWEARAGKLDEFCQEANIGYLPKRLSADMIGVEEITDDIHAARGLLFRRPDQVVPEPLRPYYRQSNEIMETLLSRKPLREERGEHLDHDVKPGVK